MHHHHDDDDDDDDDANDITHAFVLMKILINKMNIKLIN